MTFPEVQMAEGTEAVAKAMGEGALHDKEKMSLEMVDHVATNTSQTPEEREAERRLERRLLWKIDLVILPLLALTYFLSSMASHGSSMTLAASY